MDASTALLVQFLPMPAETEWLEFKRARNTFNTNDLGQYVSGLANEANLAGREEGWMVFGVDDAIDAGTGRRPVSGTMYATTGSEVNGIKQAIASHTTPAVALDDPLVVWMDCDDGERRRAVLWRVPAAPRGMPVAWKGHYWGRAGEALGALALHKFDSLRAQSTLQDWSAALVTDDWSLLNPTAIDKARSLYARRHASQGHLIARMQSKSDSEWLHDLRLAVHGRLTRAALVLLGGGRAAAHLGGPSPRISWVLEDYKGEIQTHEHFELPLLLGIDSLVARLRIIQVQLLPPRQTAPLNLPNYDDWVIREALHNCIAHQDYRLGGGRIRVTESPDALKFFNLGAFLPGSVEKVLTARQPEQRYRNACLADAMVLLDLMETLNRGVKDMFRIQKERFFPLPDYELAEQPASVGVTIYGRTLDERYVQALMAHTDLSLEDALLLDRVQKGRAIEPAQARSLRARRWVEGRGTKLRISAELARATGHEVDYVNAIGPDAVDCKKMVLNLLALGPQPRSKIDSLLLSKLGLWMPELHERKAYVKALLKELVKTGAIRNVGGATRAALWALPAPGAPKASQSTR